MNSKRGILSIAILSVLSLLICTPIIAGSNGTEDGIASKLAEAIDLYIVGEFEKGLVITDELLTRTDLSPTDSIAIYEAKSIITYARGNEFKKKAFAYLGHISEIGHCLVNLPREIWPSELRDRWYHLCKKNNSLSCPIESESQVKTIAIMEFDNFSVGKYKEELGSLSKGLADFFEYDFSKFSDLKVVERDKLDFILRELKMVEEGKIDKSTAIKVGKILGARMMVFGSITQIDKNNAAMLARAVDVETSEIIAIAEERGKPNFVDMEKALVKKLVRQLDILVPEETAELIDKSGTSDMTAAKLYSIGLTYLDKYEYEKAYNHFKKAYDKDNSFAQAKRKMEVYKPFII